MTNNTIVSQYPSDESETEDDLADSLFRIMLTQNQQVSQIMMKAFQIMANSIMSSFTRADPTPYHTSVLTGQMWVQELLDGHPDRIHNKLGIQKHVFTQLANELVSQGFTGSKHITLKEQLAIFLYTCITGLSCKHIGEHFQRSNSTISKFVFLSSQNISNSDITRYFHKMLDAFSTTRIYTKYVKLPRSDDPIPTCILNDPAVYPYLENAIGAIDGTHIACTPSVADRDATRNRKGFYSQNCLVACSFDLDFLYVLSGWEDSVADASVYHDACTTDFTIPDGKYYLADAGYPICPQLLIPYYGKIIFLTFVVCVFVFEYQGSHIGYIYFMFKMGRRMQKDNINTKQWCN